MTNFIPCRSRQSICLTALCVAASYSLALGSPPPTPTQVRSSVEITYMAGSPASVLPDKAMLVTAWITPQGKRYDLPDGRAFLEPRDSTFAYALDAQAKTATRQAPDAEDSLIGTSPDVFVGNTVVGKVAISHRSLLGYPCLVKKGTVDIDNIPTPEEVWLATVGGQRVTLKSRGGSGNAFLVVEAVSVRVFRAAPPGLLDIPAGYTVVAQQAATP